MASCITEEDITKLRAAGYLAENIAHRLPTEGQITPTPKSRENSSVPLSFRPRTRISTSPLCLRAHVLLWAGLPGSSPKFRSQHLGVYRRMRGLLLCQASLRPVATNLLREAEDRERPASGMWRRHGGQDAQCYLT